MKEETPTKIINIWHFIDFTSDWENCNTSKLDEISPSWFRRKGELEKNSTEYAEFIERLKRQHAIETGIVERMYDIEKGVTETLIEKGFVDTYLSHGDFSDNITKAELMNHLRDHLNAIDLVFDFVKSDRSLTIGFIKELHQLVTSHQEFAEGRDQFGHKHKIALIKGRFKERENNPSRVEDNEKVTYKYCPPEHVEAEMDNLILIYDQLLARQMHPVITAAWFHHSFSIIHPFQDGNGRLARLLASLIFIKFGYFPLTVLRKDAKEVYIKSLEDADKGSYQPIVDYFIDLQRKNIEDALNLKPVNSSSFEQLAGLLSEKLKASKLKSQQERSDRIAGNRLQVFNYCNEILNSYLIDLQDRTKGFANIYLSSCSPDDPSRQHYFTYQIVQFATEHKYYFNRFLPKAWFRLVFEVPVHKSYELVISLHHFGYEDDSFAMGAFLEFHEPEDDIKRVEDLDKNNIRIGQNNVIISNIPLGFKPYKISLDTASIQDRQSNIHTYLNDVITLTLSQIVNEII